MKSADFINIFLFYKKLNEDIYISKFFGYEYRVSDEKFNIENKNRIPIFISQMGILFALSPDIYTGYLNQEMINFLATKFRENVIFVLRTDDGRQGKLDSILVMQTTQSDRKLINDFIAKNLDDICKYQFLTTEYDPLYENYKLLNATTSKFEKAEDVVLCYF